MPCSARSCCSPSCCSVLGPPGRSRGNRAARRNDRGGDARVVGQAARALCRTRRAPVHAPAVRTQAKLAIPEAEASASARAVGALLPYDRHHRHPSTRRRTTLELAVTRFDRVPCRWRARDRRMRDRPSISTSRSTSSRWGRRVQIRSTEACADRRHRRAEGVRRDQRATTDRKGRPERRTSTTSSRRTIAPTRSPARSPRPSGRVGSRSVWTTGADSSRTAPSCTCPNAFVERRLYGMKGLQWGMDGGDHRVLRPAGRGRAAREGDRRQR